MKRRIKDGEQYKESKVISTQDIYLGTDNTSSLDEHLRKQDETINQLKKWTKWYVKYGGMGSGSGGGGGSVTTGFKAYIKDNSTSVEITNKERVNLWGVGDYYLTINLTKTQGHAFEISYSLGGGTTSKKIISEGNSNISIPLRFSNKTILHFEIIDSSTDEIIGTQDSTIIPESYQIFPSLKYKTGGNVEKNGQITYEVVKDQLNAEFNYTISEAIEVGYKVIYKLETETEWHELTRGTFRYSETGEVVTGVETIPLTLNDLDKESSLGVKIIFQLIYGLNVDATVSSEGYYELTIVPQGFYIIFGDNGKGTLYLNEIHEEDEVNQINKGLLPFTITLSSESTVYRSISVSIYKKIEENNWIQVIAPVTNTITSGTTYSLSSLYKISVTDPGIYKIVGGGIDEYVPPKYFRVKESNSNWSFTQYDNYVPARTTTHYYLQDDATTPFLTSPIELFSNSLVKEIEQFTDTKFNYTLHLGIQYDSSNDDNDPMITLKTTEGEIQIYQNKIIYGADELIKSYYFPKTESSDVSKDDYWHLFTINMSYVSSKEDGTKNYFEFSIFIDGVLEGVSSGVGEVGTTTALDKIYGVYKITINPTATQTIKLNLFDVVKTIIGNEATFDKDVSKLKGKYAFIPDTFITSYYNNYKSTLGYGDDDIIDSTTCNESILSYFEFDEYGIPYTNYETLSNLISYTYGEENNKKLLKVPIIVLCPREKSSDRVGEGNFFKKWFLASWPENPTNENSNPPTLTGYIYYVPEDSLGDKLDDFKVVDESGSIISFSFEIQGSSTKAFSIKNIELGISQGVEGKTRVFTPNFDKDDKNTFLPEESFTLKADMVDSSACNNNSIGAFINTNTKPLDENNCEARNTAFGGHIKNCLTGTPVLVFLSIDNSGGTATEHGKFYYVGIYNFNLGRKSYFNLGYYNQASYGNISELLDGVNPGSLRIMDITPPEISSNLTVTEISDGKKYYDFSQYHESVLFSFGISDDFSMFSSSDSLFSDEIRSKTLLQNAVKAITLGGGYIFDRLGKNRIKLNNTDKTPYLIDKNLGTEEQPNFVSLNYVSDYMTQYKRGSTSTAWSEYTELPQIDPANEDNLIDCIGIIKEDPSGGTQNIIPYLDLRSTVEYYVICMVFGMTDSVLKNMELKSWGTKTIYPAFYDMDTSLGVDNNAGDVSFFDFSDYWKNNEEIIREGLIKSNGIDIYPDYHHGSGGYDIPSSYLFALAKYSTLLLLNIRTNLPKISSTEAGGTDSVDISPVNIYSLYRKRTGDLENAETFFNKYFNRLHNIPNSFKNLNYRAKYAKVAHWRIEAYNASGIYDMKGDIPREVSVSEISDVDKLKGTGTYKKLDWLKSRLRLLDAYFNINPSVNYRIRKANLTGEDGYGNVDAVEWVDLKNGDTYYSYPNLSTSVGFSDDVSITSQIFDATNGTKSSLSVGTFYVKAPSYTPVVIYQSGQQPSSYLIGDNTRETQYVIPLYTVGNQAWGIYGSREFSNISNLGLVQLDKSRITSTNLEDVYYLDSSEISQSHEEFTLSTPNIKIIRINSTKYSGKLTLDEAFNYNRLTEIDLTNSRVYLSCEKRLVITTLKLEGINIPSNNILLPNLSQLNTVTLDKAKINELQLPMWKSNISITQNASNISETAGYDYHNVSIRKLTINNTNELSGTKLRIHSISTLEEVSVLNGIEELEIHDCANLRKIVINNKLKKLVVDNCANSAASFTIGNGSSLDVTNKVNLSTTSITDLNLNYTKKFNIIDIGDNIVNLGVEALAFCTDLEYLDNGTNGKYLLNGNRVFYYDSKFTLKSSSGSYPKVIINTSNLSQTFGVSSSSTGAIGYDAINTFFNNNADLGNDQGCALVENIQELCVYQKNIGTGWTFSTYITNLSECVNLSNAKHAFARCGIQYWTANMFNFGQNCSEVNINGMYCDTSANVRIDYLKNIGDRISDLSNRHPNSGGDISYKFYPISGSSPISDLKLYEVLKYLTKLKTFSSFASIKNATVDLKDCFKECKDTLTSVTYLMHSDNNWYNLIYDRVNPETGDTEKYSCFKDLTRLNQVGGILRTSSTISGHSSVDLFNVFTANQWKSIQHLFDWDLTNFGTTFNCKKWISLGNFETLKSYLVTNTTTGSLTILSNIFANTDIIDCGTTMPTLTFPYTSASKVTSLYRTFYNLRAWEGEADIQDTRVPININNPDSDVKFFKYFTNVTTCCYTFALNWINEVIPFDFFCKRGNIITRAGYYPNIEQPSIDPTDDSQYEYIYFTRNYTDASAPTLPVVDDNTKPASQQKSISTESVISMWTIVAPTLSNLDTGTIKTSRSKREFWRARRTKPTGGTSTYGDFSEGELMERFNNPIEVTARYCVYNNRIITDIRGLFYNTIYQVPFFKYESDWYDSLDQIRSTIKDSGGNDDYEYYFTNEDCTPTSKGGYRASIELDDLEIGRTPTNISRASDITVEGTSFRNYSLVHDSYVSDNNTYPFISPDFFYGLSDKLYFDSVFANTTSTTSDLSDIRNGKKSRQLEGYIPEHLLSSLTQLRGYSNFLQNLNIVPVRYNSTNNYVFVPQNFIPTNINNLTNLFTFHIRVPSHSHDSSMSEQNHTFYVAYSNSVSTSSSSIVISNTFPSYVTHGTSSNSVIWTGQDGGALDVIEDDYNFNYHFLLNPAGNEGSGIEDTLDSCFRSASYSNLVSQDLLYVLSGRIWSNELPLNLLAFSGTVFTGVVVYGSIQRGFNRNITLPETMSSFNNSIFWTTPNRIHINTVNNSRTAWENTYGSITFVEPS